MSNKTRMFIGYLLNAILIAITMGGWVVPLFGFWWIFIKGQNIVDEVYVGWVKTQAKRVAFFIIIAAVFVTNALLDR